MKWLTLEKIKAQLRIDPSFTLEDEILTMYGESAEDSVLDIIRRSYTEVMEKYGTVPTPLVHASLMLVDLSYKERGPVSSQNLYQVPYATVVRHFSKRLFWLSYPHTENIKQWQVERVRKVFGYRQFDDVLDEYLSRLQDFKEKQNEG